MDSPYLGEIRSIAFNYAPKGWALCSGQLLPIAQNQALFSLLGTTYGGDGRTTFALPNLQSRVPVGVGQLAGGTNYTLGATGGNESVGLQQAQIPSHTHQVTGTFTAGDGNGEASPSGNYPGSGGVAMYAAGSKAGVLGNISGTTAGQGSSTPHENRMPYMATYFVIALQGLFPSRP